MRQKSSSFLEMQEKCILSFDPLKFLVLTDTKSFEKMPKKIIVREVHFSQISLTTCRSDKSVAVEHSNKSK